MFTSSALKKVFLVLTAIASLSSCTKSSDLKRPQAATKVDQAGQAQQSDSQQSENEFTTVARAASTDTTDAIKFPSVKAQSGDQSLAQSSDVSSATQVQSSDTTAAVDEEGEDTLELTPVQKPQEKPVAAPAVQAKAEDSIRVEVKDANVLAQLVADSSLVRHSQKIQKESDIKSALMKGNEDHYCKVVTKDQLAAGDKLPFDVSEIKQVNADLDVYETTLTFKSEKKSIQFVCTHTTSNFYVEDFAQNFLGVIDMFNIDGKLVDLKGYMNPRTENRTMNAIKLIDTDKLEKVILDEKAQEGFGLNNGNVISIDVISNKIAAGVERVGCMVAEKGGTFDKTKVYIRVEKGVATDTPKDIPTATMYSIYRADEKNYFVLTCQMYKDARWLEMTSAAKGVIQFEALPRLEYNKKFDEVMEIHKRLKQQN